MVRDFLHNAVFHTNYFYVILTYGNRHGGAAELAKLLCEECGIRVNYINVVQMVDNWLPSFDMNEQVQLDKQEDAKIVLIKEYLAARKNQIAAVTEADRAAHQQFLSRIRQMPKGGPAPLFIRVTDTCAGCGICREVCPTGSMQLQEGKAVYVPKDCQTCLACVRACPQKAIGLAVPEKNPDARYWNRHIRLQEIITANHQA